MSCYSIDNVIPVIHKDTFVHPDASIIGDVIIGSGCYIGPGASLRGDFGRILVGQGSNIQDNCVLHSTPGIDMVVETNGHIGHGAIIHACLVRKNALVGINAVIMDDAVIGESSIVAASTFIKTGFECLPRSLVVGTPGKVMRTLTDNEVSWKDQATALYHRLTVRCLDSFKEVSPLSAEEPNRKRLENSDRFLTYKQAKEQ